MAGYHGGWRHGIGDGADGRRRPQAAGGMAAGRRQAEWRRRRQAASARPSPPADQCSRHGKRYRSASRFRVRRASPKRSATSPTTRRLAERGWGAVVNANRYQRSPRYSSRPTRPRPKIWSPEPGRRRCPRTASAGPAPGPGTVGRARVGEHAGEEQGQVPEPAVHTWALGLRHHIDQRRQLDGIELGEPPAPPAACGPFPDRATGHVGVRRQQLGQEEPATGVGQEVRQLAAPRTGSRRRGPIHSSTATAPRNDDAARCTARAKARKGEASARTPPARAGAEDGVEGRRRRPGPRPTGPGRPAGPPVARRRGRRAAADRPRVRWSR